MATDHTTGRTPFARLSDCEQTLRTTDYIETRVDEADEERFEVINPVPLTLDNDVFEATVRDAVRRNRLRVHPTEDAFRFVVSVPGASR
jgi:hypothetical protein